MIVRRFDIPCDNPAAHEGGPRNGVLTAIEDFLADRPSLRLAFVPSFYGLGGENGDMNLAWLAGDLTWKIGRPEALFSWTGTPLLAAIMANPDKFGYAYSPDNFGSTAQLLRLGGTRNWRLYEVAVLLIAALAGLWTRHALRGRSVISWEAFGFVALFSVLISPIDWGHYGIVFTPLFVVLVVGMSREGASLADWLGLALAYALASLVWRPYGTLTGNVHTFLSTGHLPPERANSGEAVGMEALSQGAQYVLLLTGILWFLRRPGWRSGGQACAGEAREAT